MLRQVNLPNIFYVKPHDMPMTRHLVGIFNSWSKCKKICKYDYSKINLNSAAIPVQTSAKYEYFIYHSSPVDIVFLIIPTLTELLYAPLIMNQWISVWPNFFNLRKRMKEYARYLTYYLWIVVDDISLLRWI